jgi:hypothetical protein
MGTVRLLKVATAPGEGGEYCRGHFGLLDGIGDPPARADVDEVDRDAVLVVTERSVDPPEPVEPVGVPCPHERSVGHIGEPGDATGQPFVGLRVAETDQPLRQSAIHGALRVDVVAAGPHRRAVHIGHPRYSALEMETFKRYLFFQAMMFVFGIVGPIFLILFFASPPDPDLRWAYWSGLFITTADILIALLLAGANPGTKTPKDAKVALALQKKLQTGRSDTSGSSSSSSSDPFFGGAFTFATSDSASSSDSGWFSSDSGSSSSDSGSSSSDSGSSSSDSGSSSSSSD